MFNLQTLLYCAAINVNNALEKRWVSMRIRAAWTLNRALWSRVYCGFAPLAFLYGRAPGCARLGTTPLTQAPRR